jgi:hypothetical protein
MARAKRRNRKYNCQKWVETLPSNVLRGRKTCLRCVFEYAGGSWGVQMTAEFALIQIDSRRNCCAIHRTEGRP